MQPGEQHNLADTTAFLELLKTSAAQGTGSLFESSREIIVTRAPGRLDLMGGIADYSGSLVLELPIASATHAALQRQADRQLRLLSLPAKAGEPPRVFEMPLADFEAGGEPIDYAAARRYFNRRPQSHWAAYVAGAFLVLMRERGARFDFGARMLLASNVPEGKGVSSSAALEVAAMQAIASSYEIDLSPRELAFLSQKVENYVVGAPCGLMDQMTSACGEEDRLLALLCQPGEMQGTVQLPDELAVWGIDSGIRHSVGGEDYGTVRTAAFMGYRLIAEMAGLPCRASGNNRHVEVDDRMWKGYLANITPAEFAASFAAGLPPRMTGQEFLERYEGITDPVTAVERERIYPVYEATRHPIFEHERVMKFARILSDWQGGGQAERLGELMYESHESYSACQLGSAGTDELVRLVREAGPAGGLYGAKITGGGSGGAVAVLGRREAEATVSAIAKEYARRTGYPPLVISGSSPGAAQFGHLRLTK